MTDLDRAALDEAIDAVTDALTVYAIDFELREGSILRLFGGVTPQTAFVELHIDTIVGDAIRAYLSRASAPSVGEAEVDEANERRLFTAWASTEWLNSSAPDNAWKGWQARALLSRVRAAAAAESEVAKLRALSKIVREYLDEIDSPVADPGYRKTLRDRMRTALNPGGSNG